MSKGQSEHIAYSKDGKYLCATKQAQTSTVWETTNYTLVNAYPKSKIGIYPYNLNLTWDDRYLLIKGHPSILWDFDNDTLYKQIIGEFGKAFEIDSQYKNILLSGGGAILIQRPTWLATEVTQSINTNNVYSNFYENGKLFLTSKDNNLISNISIYDLQGKTIFQKEESSIHHEIILPELSGNIIFIKAKVNGTFYTNKFMLPN
jgi:hypothetical protein